MDSYVGESRFFPKGICFTLVITIIALRDCTAAEKPSCELKTLNASTVLAYAGWPFRVDCRHLRREWTIDSASYAGNSNISCRLSRDGNVQIGNIFTIESMGDSKAFTAELVINETTCLANQVVIDLLPFPNETCLSSLNDPKRLIHKQNYISIASELKCGIHGDLFPEVIPRGANMADFKTKWISSNCAETRYRTNMKWDVQEGPPGYGETLNMPSPDFYDAVTFTCSVQYKGKTLYPVTYSQCIIRSADIRQHPSLNCDRTRDVPKYGTAKLNCEGHMVGGTTKTGDFKIQWKKDGKVLCENNFFDLTNIGGNNRVSCISKDSTRNESFPCFYFVSKDVLPPNKTKSISLNFEIRDLQYDDFGNYTVVFKARSKGKLESNELMIMLTEDRTPYLRLRLKIFSSILAITITLTVVGIFTWKNRIYILVAYKRSTLWKYDQDDKTYVACLSYHFDREDNSPDGMASSIASEVIVTAIQNFMKENDYKYYDEQRDIDFGPEIENIAKLVEECHRMVLVLTPKYLEDRLKRFQTDLSFRALLDSGMGLILIVTPGVKKLLAEKSKYDKVWKKLRIMLRTNRVINWTEKMTEDTLLKHIEYSMPKLKRSIAYKKKFKKNKNIYIRRYSISSESSDQFLQA